MILLRMVLGIARIVLRILIFLGIVACLVPFFITMVSSFGGETDFWTSFTTQLGAYHYGELATSQRMVGLICMMIGLGGGIVLSLISILIKKAGFFTMLCGILSIVGAFLVFPTLSQESINAFFGGTTTVENYVVYLTMALSATLGIVGLYHFTGGLKASLK